MNVEEVALQTGKLFLLVREAFSQGERIFPQDPTRVRAKYSMQTASELSEGARAG